MIPQLPNAQVHIYYHACDAFVNLNENEIFGMSLLEAMYAGCPPVARHAPGPDLIIENGISGLLCGTVPELAAALGKTTAAMGHAAQTRVNEHFLWQNSAELALTLLPKKGKNQWITTILLCRRLPTSTAACAFTMKYRGVDILPAAAGNDLARDLLKSGQPFLFGRCGATEMRTVADWLQNGGHNFTDRTRADIRNLSGVFPTDDATLDKFCRLYVKTAQSAELLALERRGRAGRSSAAVTRPALPSCARLGALLPRPPVERRPRGQTGARRASVPPHDFSPV